MKLSIKNLSKTYRNGVKAIDNLSIEIDKGMFGLLGPNGAGKSTLMRTIATLQIPDEGTLGFGGIDLLKDPMSLRKVLGYLPQDFGVYPKMSAEKLLDYFALLKGIDHPGERHDLIEKVLVLTNLEDVRKKYVSGYSGGMKQRFGIAQLLLNDPQLLIVDEPTAGLDPSERNRFLNVLREVGNESTVIFSTHIVEDVKELCTDMAIMDRGSILYRTTPLEAIKSIEGCVWMTHMNSAEESTFRTSNKVLSTGFNPDNSIYAKVFSHEKPEGTFQPAAATLEDVYFYTLAGQSNHL